MPIQDRRIQEKRELKEKIITTAIEIAGESGWSQVSVRNISERIRYSSIMIYSLFGSKENLFAELKRFGFGKLLEAYARMIPTNDDQKKAVKDLTESTLSFYFENRQLYQVMFGIIGLPGVPDSCGEESDSYRVAEFIKNVLSNAAEGDIDSLFFRWWALVHGFISIGASMSEDRFRQILPYLDEALEKFLE